MSSGNVIFCKTNRETGNSVSGDTGWTVTETMSVTDTAGDQLSIQEDDPPWKPPTPLPSPTHPHMYLVTNQRQYFLGTDGRMRNKCHQVRISFNWRGFGVTRSHCFQEEVQVRPSSTCYCLRSCYSKTQNCDLISAEPARLEGILLIPKS